MSNQFIFLSNFLEEQDVIYRLSKKIDPAIDMLVQKPSLYFYIANNELDKVKSGGIIAKNNRIKCYFSRLPESLPEFRKFIFENTPVKISTSKLKKIKDQQVEVFAINSREFNSSKSLSDDDIQRMNKKEIDYSKGLQNSPHAELYLSNGLLPSYVMKFQE